LGGFCWSIAGANYDIDITFQDDLTMAQKMFFSLHNLIANYLNVLLMFLKK